jgi:hypothetical protein
MKINCSSVVLDFAVHFASDCHTNRLIYSEAVPDKVYLYSVRSKIINYDELCRQTTIEVENAASGL